MTYTHYAVFPSADPGRADACISKWRSKGYRTLVHLDHTRLRCAADVVDYGAGAYPGYYKLTGHLARKAFDHGADLVTCIGDDMLPPEQGAQWIAEEYFSKFPLGYGVYQGCGDPQGVDSTGKPAAARICGSPTFGEGWARSGYRGAGPFCTEYFNYYGDEDLFNVAGRLGILFMDPKVTIMHKHWSWGHMQIQEYHRRNQGKWALDEQTFIRRKEAGFPGSELS